MTKFLFNPLVDWVVWRIDRNKNAIIVINGSTGSGKSWSAISLAEEIAKKLDTPFTINGNVDFSFSGLLKKTMKEENKKPGTCFVFEEVGAVGGGAASREWQSKANKFFFSFMQTTRHRNQILIFTCPMFSFLDAGARSLVHMQLLMSGINYEQEKAYVTPYALQVNPRTGKTYFKKLRFKWEGKNYKLDRHAIVKPPLDMVNEYEKMKTKYTTQLNINIIKEEEEFIQSQHKKQHNKLKRQEELDKVRTLLHKGLTQEEIGKIIGKSIRTVRNIKRKLETERNIGLYRRQVDL